MTAFRISLNGEWSIVLRAAAIFLIGLIFGVAVALVYRADARTHRSAGSDAGASADFTRPSGQAAELPPRRAIVALGTLEPRDGIVQITSALAGYQIKQVPVQEGQLVNAGDALVVLDAQSAEAERELARSQLAEAVERQETEIALAQERLATARLAARHANEGRELELAVQQSRIAVAAATKKQAEKDVERLQQLSELAEPLATAQQVEQQRLLLERAAAEHEAAQVALKRLEQSLTFQSQTAQAEQHAAEQSLAVAEKGIGVESLKRRVELADLKLKQTQIVAPAAGIVLSVMAHPGEVVAQQPLVQLADLDHLICVAEVEAGDVPYLLANHKAVVSCRAFQGSPLEGTVVRVGYQVTAATLRPLDPRKPVDRDVTRVVVALDSSKAARAINASGIDRRAALVGLQVEVAFPLADRGP